VVTLRTREIGIRLALGATPRAVAGAMTRYGIELTGLGLGVGLLLFALLARYLRVLLYGVAASDPITLGGAALILLMVAMLASWGRRAGRHAWILRRRSERSSGGMAISPMESLTARAATRRWPSQTTPPAHSSQHAGSGYEADVLTAPVVLAQGVDELGAQEAEY